MTPSPRSRHRAPVLLALLAIATLFATTASAQGANVTTIPSQNAFDETVTRLEGAIEDAGLIHVITIDHAANAEGAGLDLPPTQLFVFGNPQAGTPLMQAERTMALELPQKMLVWEDDAGAVFVSWKDPIAVAALHGLPADTGALLNIADLLQRLADSATGAD